MSKSSFSNSQSTTNSPYTSTSPTSGSSDIQLSFYQNLANTIAELDALLTNYSLGNFSSVVQTLTMSEYNYIASLLNNLQQSASLYPDYETIRNVINMALQGLLQSVNQYIILTNTQNNLAICEQKSAILNNITELQNYLNGLKGSRTVFPNVYGQSIVATIKPEYVTYIQLYGYPPNGIFEIDKLAPIIQSLQ